MIANFDISKMIRRKEYAGNGRIFIQRKPDAQRHPQGWSAGVQRDNLCALPAFQRGRSGKVAERNRRNRQWDRLPPAHFEDKPFRRRRTSGSRRRRTPLPVGIFPGTRLQPSRNGLDTWRFLRPWRQRGKALQLREDGQGR